MLDSVAPTGLFRWSKTEMVSSDISDVDEALRTKLLAMADRDERLRAELLAGGELFDGYNEQMARLHTANARRLEAIVDRHGWPGKSLAGGDGSHAAWIVLQHAIGCPQLLRRCLPLLQEAARRGEVEAFQPAFLEDRICAFQGEAQPYGTQFDWDEHGELSPLRLRDPERVDELRARVGLEPLAEHIEQARVRAALDGETPPADHRARLAAKRVWAKSVGWL